MLVGTVFVGMPVRVKISEWLDSHERQSTGTRMQCKTRALSLLDDSKITAIIVLEIKSTHVLSRS